MINKSRREFLKKTGKTFLNLGRMVILGIFSYSILFMLKVLLNITYEGWYLILYLLALFILIFVINLLINKSIQTYENNIGEKAKKNIIACSMVLHSILIGFCSTRLTVAYFNERWDNVIMWSALAMFILKEIYSKSKNS